ncbi:MAG: hypothetical protein ACXACY_29290 [Candidatus Hodarchaeales archaeon]|jgi:hypothetical protein
MAIEDKINFFADIHEGELSEESKVFVADLMQAILIKEYDLAMALIMNLDHENNNYLSRQILKLQRILDIVGV